MNVTRKGLTKGVPGSQYGVRAGISGVNVDRFGKPHPRVSREHFLTMVKADEQSDDTVIGIILRRLCVPGSDMWKNYMAIRRGVKVEAEDGLYDYIVERRREPRFVPPWEEQKYGMERDEKGVKVKTYSLSQIFSDGYVRSKYNLSPEFVNSVSDMALTSPADAAATFQQYMQIQTQQELDRKKSQGLETGTPVNIKVTAGVYSNGKAGAVRDIRMAANKVRALQAGTPCRVFGDIITAYSDDSSEPRWSVRGPLSATESVMNVMRLAYALGKHETVHLFAQETAKLQIDIFDGKYVVSPEIRNHSRANNDFRFLEESGVVEDLDYSIRDRFEQMSVNVLPLQDGTVHRASAIRLDSGVVLVTQHEYDGMQDAVVDGQRLGRKQVVGSDLWAFMHRGEFRAWTYREPVIGEMACVMFHNGEKVTLSASFRVVSCDGSLLISDAVDGVYPGMSGGAVVGLSDMALLGVHCGAVAYKLRATRLTETTYYDICEFRSESSLQDDVAVSGWEKLSRVLRARGLASSLQSTLESLTGLYTPQGHVGTGVKYKSRVITTLPEGFYENVSGYSLGCLEFEDVGGLQVGALGSSLPSVERVRRPVIGEAVFLVGLENAGPLVSEQLQVRKVGSYAMNFSLSACSGLEVMTGAAVVSLHDGYVLGLMVKESQGSVFCVSLVEGAVRPDVVQSVSRAFPKFAVKMWDTAQLADALDATSEKSAVLATLARADLTARVTRELWTIGIPYSQWDAHVKRTLSDSALAASFENTGLSDCVVVESSAGVATEAEKALVMLALVAVVSEYESSEDLEAWLEGLGIAKLRGVMLRRSSGFDVLSGDGRVLPPYG